MWQLRGIIINFAVSDLKVRYKNSFLGFFWAILEPLLLLGVMYVVFSQIFKFEIPNFPIYLLLGIIIWNMFRNGTSIGLNSLINRAPIMTQIYFPRSVPSISSSITASMMFIFEVAVFGVFIAIFQFTPPPTIVYLPLILVLELILVMAISLPLSVLNIKFKDVEFIWTVILQLGFFLTPIFYQFSMLPESLQNILQYSPMVQIVTMAHHVTLYGTIPSVNSILYSVVSVFLIFGICYGIFRKLQSRIVEEI